MIKELDLRLVQAIPLKREMFLYKIISRLLAMERSYHSGLRSKSKSLDAPDCHQLSGPQMNVLLGISGEVDLCLQKVINRQVG
jgi:hypothetical protein